MSETLEVAQIRIAIKKLLKKHGYTYADLGKLLKLSEPAVKRLMAKGTFTIGRIETIAQSFGLSFFEFMEMAGKMESKPYQFNPKQEQVLVKNPLALYALLLLGSGFSLQEVQARIKLNQKELMDKVLFVLDKIDLITLEPSNRVRLKCRAPFRWIRGGILQGLIYEDFVNLVSRSLTTTPDPEGLQRTFEMYLSPRLLKRMKLDLEAIVDRYQHLSRIEKELSPANETHPVIGMAFLKPYDGWGEILKGKAKETDK